MRLTIPPFFLGRLTKIWKFIALVKFFCEAPADFLFYERYLTHATFLNVQFHSFSRIDYIPWVGLEEFIWYSRYLPKCNIVAKLSVLIHLR